MDSSDDAWMTFDEVKSEVGAQRPFVQPVERRHTYRRR